MEQRYKFNFFLAKAPCNEEPFLHNFYIEKGDEFFIGKELHIHNNVITYYVYPISENEGMLLLYLSDDVFDNLVDGINEYNFQGVANAWPMLVKALLNGKNDNYTAAALIKLNCQNFSFWTMCTRIENIDIYDLDTKYIVNKLSNLYSYTIDMLDEIEENDISTWDRAKGGIQEVYHGYKQASAIGKLAGTVASLGLGMMGLDGFSDFIPNDEA